MSDRLKLWCKVIAFCLGASLTLSPDAGAGVPGPGEPITDEQIDAAAAANGADAGLMKKIRRCETPSGGWNSFQITNEKGGSTAASQADWAAKQVAAGNAGRQWRVCSGRGGRARGRSAPALRTCISHTEWTEAGWTIQTYRSVSCEYPDPPAGHETPNVFVTGCGWRNVGTESQAWGCTLKYPIREMWVME